MHPPELIEEIGKDLPTILYRTNPRFRELTGLSPRTMANLDSRGHGPAQRVKLGKTVGYAYSGDSGHVIHWKAASCSAARRPLHRSEATLVF
jgi:hypothetical protein